VLWKEGEIEGKFMQKEDQCKVDTWLSERLKQCAGKQALQMVKSQNKKEDKAKPEYNARVMELDQRFVTFCGGSEGFDEWIRIGSIGNKMIFCLPVKFHRHYNKYVKEGWERKKSIRIREYNGNLYVDIFFEKAFEKNNKEKQMGIDIGINKVICTSEGEKIGDGFNGLLDKIGRKQHGSKAWHRAIREKNEYINICVKKINFKELGYLHIEDLTGINKRTMKVVRKRFRNRRMMWSYRHLKERIKLSCEVDGVHCHEINPAYTSQACSKCGFVHKLNRSCEIFLCRNCGYKEDADINASRNILKSGLTWQNMVAKRTKAGVA
jgi:IS605 OrfB family transposase